MILVLDDLGIQLVKINVINNDIVINKNATKEELSKMLSETNELRAMALDQLVGFHMGVKSTSSELEFAPIMKAFNKEMSISVK